MEFIERSFDSMRYRVRMSAAVQESLLDFGDEAVPGRGSA